MVAAAGSPDLVPVWRVPEFRTAQMQMHAACESLQQKTWGPKGRRSGPERAQEDKHITCTVGGAVEPLAVPAAGGARGGGGCARRTWPCRAS